MLLAAFSAPVSAEPASLLITAATAGPFCLYSDFIASVAAKTNHQENGRHGVPEAYRQAGNINQAVCCLQSQRQKKNQEPIEILP